MEAKSSATKQPRLLIPTRRLARLALTLTAALPLLMAIKPSAAQDILYNNLDTNATYSGLTGANAAANGSPAYLNNGFIIQTTRTENGNTIDTLVTQMMSDDIFLATTAPVVTGAYWKINSIEFAATNSSTVALNDVRIQLRIWSDDYATPVPPYPQVSNDSPGTLVAAYDLGTFNFGAAAPTGTGGTLGIVSEASNSLQKITVDSSMLGDLTLPYDDGNNAKYWFGLFYEQDRNNLLTFDEQRDQLQGMGLALYTDVPVNGTAGNHSADVHHETDVFARNSGGGFNYQASRFDRSFGVNPGDGNGAYIQYRALTGQDINSNFGWLIRGQFVVPEPGAGVLVLLGLPVLGFVVRRRGRKA
ncbi:MAG: hypothetical protein OHK0029_06600 [Armatimonadaceae bacterium]